MNVSENIDYSFEMIVESQADSTLTKTLTSISVGQSILYIAKNSISNQSRNWKLPSGGTYRWSMMKFNDEPTDTTIGDIYQTEPTVSPGGTTIGSLVSSTGPIWMFYKRLS
jgi:hypothetical protein